jgi:hypothetical protein
LCVPSIPENLSSALDGCHRAVIKPIALPCDLAESFLVAEIVQPVKSA